MGPMAAPALWRTPRRRTGRLFLAQSRQRTPAEVTTVHLWQIGRSHLPHETYVTSFACFWQKKAPSALAETGSGRGTNFVPQLIQNFPGFSASNPHRSHFGMTALWEHE